jgi:hypothetical protein
MFLLLWNSPIVAHDQRSQPMYAPRQEPMDYEDDELLLLWWALNEQATY